MDTPLGEIIQMVSARIDITCDLGEGFGIYKLADEESLMPYLTSANVACGFHAGDPHIMRKTVRLAKKYGVEVGAHPGLPDRIGFGRREIRITQQEAKDYLTYQLGALSAFLKPEGMRLQHVLPHGIFGTLSWSREDYATAVCDSVAELDPEIVIMARGGPSASQSMLYEIAKTRGLRVASLMVLDMDYEQDGTLVVTRTHVEVEPMERYERLKLLAKNKKMKTRTGLLDYSAETTLVHSDTPNVVALLKTIREQAENDDIEIKPLKDILR